MTNTPKHTPGPWFVDENESQIITKGTRLESITNLLVHTEATKKLDTLYPGYQEMQRANAHLIAAAPEMYEALSLCQKWFEHQGKTGGDLPLFRAIVDKAIEKAEGRA